MVRSAHHDSVHHRTSPYHSNRSIDMNTMTVVMGIPEKIRFGLESGLYERVGGVVRNAQTKQIVMWLREAGASNVLQQMPLILQASSVASLLNLGISAASFAVIVHRLGVINDRLKQVQSALEAVGQ